MRLLKRLLDHRGPGEHQSPPVRLGLRGNLPEFAQRVGINALMGWLVDQERTALPGDTVMPTFIVALGITRAVVRFFAGTLADRFDRKPVLPVG